MQADNVIEAWLEVDLAVPGRTQADALRDLSEDLIADGVWSGPASDGRLSEWRRGLRTPPPEALRYMARVAAGRVLREAGLDTADDYAMDAVAAALTPPPRQR